jgi:hypothetical protein
MRRRAFLGAVAAALVHRAARAQATVAAMTFSTLQPGAPLPPHLQRYAFDNQPRQTQYALVTDEGRTVLRARSQAATSGIIRELRVAPRQHPILAWRWKTRRLLEKSDLATKAGDDFPARLYLSFDLDTAQLQAGERMQLALARLLHGSRVPAAVLCYVWDARAPRETIAPNAYTDRVRMIVAESGGANLGRWVGYERDVREDFRRAFGLEAPAVSAVIVSADTDNTGESAETWFGDIEFRAR